MQSPAMVVVDASPLIALAKMGRLRLLREVYDRVAIPPQVYVEVVQRGKWVQAPEVRVVERGLDEGWIRPASLSRSEKRMSERLLEQTRLHAGEAEALALAHSRKGLLVADDKEARAVAEAFEIECVGTAGVLLEAFLKGALDYDGLTEAMRDLGRILWLSPQVTAEIIKRASEVGR